MSNGARGFFFAGSPMVVVSGVGDTDPRVLEESIMSLVNDMMDEVEDHPEVVRESDADWRAVLNAEVE